MCAKEKSLEEIAKEIAEKIERGEYIERVEAVKGYVNFFIDSKKTCKWNNKEHTKNEG